MHRSLESYRSGSVIEYDVCIIGSGPAGISLASKFVSKKLRVVILESGGVNPEEKYQQLNKGENVGKRQLDLVNSRLRCFGGAGKIWAGVCRPMSSQDFKSRKYVKYSGWPIDINQLDKYYKQASNMLDLDFDLFYDESWKQESELAVKFKGITQDGEILLGNRYQQAPVTTRDLSNKYKEIFFSHKSIDVITNATVVKLVQKMKKIEEVHIKSIQNKSATVKSKVFILCAGALENPRILLDSEVDIKNNTFLGKCFMSHPAFTGAGKIIRNENHDSCLDLDVKLQRHFGFEIKHNNQDEYQILRHNINLSPISAKTTISNFIRREDVSYMDLFKNINLLQGYEQYKCNFLNGTYVANKWNIDVAIEQQPRLSNKITLSEVKDLHGCRSLRVHWDEVSDLEMKTVFEAVKQLGRGALMANIGLCEISPSVLTKEIFKQEDAINHHMGTTRMSSSKNFGVVDSNLKCFGLDNLYISGSSVFPTSSIVNPTFTIIAMSLRLGDHLIKNRRNL